MSVRAMRNTKIRCCLRYIGHVAGGYHGPLTPRQILGDLRAIWGAMPLNGSDKDDVTTYTDIAIIAITSALVVVLLIALGLIGWMAFRG